MRSVLLSLLAISSSTWAAPVVVITSPSEGISVSGMTTVTAGLSGARRGGVSFEVDGTSINKDFSYPYSVQLDTTKFSNGNHKLTASYVKSSQTVTTSAPVQVNVTNPVTADELVTEIIGQSQTQQWWPYSQLPGWQARIQTGSGYMDWLDPSFNIWTNPVTPGVDGVVRPYSQIERVIITIGKAPFEATDTYESLVEQTITTVRSYYPNVKEIRLQPLAAGPNRTACYVDGKQVLTTVNLPNIETAIAAITARHSDVKASLVPLVNDCTEFSDSTGHLVTNGRVDVAGQVDQFYAE